MRIAADNHPDLPLRVGNIARQQAAADLQAGLGQAARRNGEGQQNGFQQQHCRGVEPNRQLPDQEPTEAVSRRQYHCDQHCPFEPFLPGNIAVHQQQTFQPGNQAAEQGDRMQSGTGIAD